MLARQAVLAGVIAQARIDDHAVANLELVVGDAAQVADRVDDAGGIGAEDPGRNDLHAGHPCHHEQVEMVERGGFDADADLAESGLGLRQIGPVLELVESAVRRDCQSSHAIIGALYSVASYAYYLEFFVYLYRAQAFTKILTLISIRSGSV